ncbi:hypothetical protein M2284_001451 [Rhodococcus sp. LBL1]|uniref:Uncharacterized protein n=1 Tax=Prescottella agglutinans TaxID=1644129 RepID=A0ABT6M825_9NOCA|nr:hypothetical protein [Prescottella agglutinans]MDH6280457.1 hypothetical protein [Prescottella agglutinans]MDH6677253.1 hypothetical protein [Rhodococcus sp. LBL1]MDH6682454.1 hypothetical protein [Rhodococcus sp. LBL2]
MSAHLAADTGRDAATWSLSTEELKHRLDRMYAGVSDTRSAEPETTAV